MNFNESQTKKNLAKSFAAECQAGARYQFMATMAQKDGYSFLKDTFKMIAKNEMAHAKLFYNYIVDKSGKECKVDIKADYPYVDPNLDTSIKLEGKIEREEFDTIYPEFAKTAKEEGFSDIAASFELVAKVEQIHAEMLEQINKGYSKGAMYKGKRLYKCSNCGHASMESQGWKTCPLCNLEQGYIELDFSQIFEKCASC